MQRHSNGNWGDVCSEKGKRKVLLEGWLGPLVPLCPSAAPPASCVLGEALCIPLFSPSLCGKKQEEGWSLLYLGLESLRSTLHTVLCLKRTSPPDI